MNPCESTRGTRKYSGCDSCYYKCSSAVLGTELFFFLCLPDQSVDPIRTRIGNVLKSASPAPNVMGASQGDALSVCPGVSLRMGLLVLQLGKSQANQDTLDTLVLQQMSVENTWE